MSIKQKYSVNLIDDWDARKGSFLSQTGSGMDMTPVASPVWENTNKGKAVKFNGVDNYLTKVTANYQVGDAEGMVEGWVKSDNTDGSVQVIWATSDTATNTKFLYVYLSSNFLFVRTQTGGSIRSTETINLNEPNHIAVAAFEGIYSMWINGIRQTLSGTNSGTWLDSVADRDNITIGAMLRTTLVTPFNGCVRQVRYWDKGDFTNEEMSELYEESLAEGFVGTLPKRNFQLPENIEGDEANLVGGWNMKNNSQVIADVSNGGNDMTIVGSVSQVEGVFGQAQKFDGSTGYATKTVADYRSGDTAGTISGWVKLDVLGVAQGIFSSMNVATGTEYLLFYVGSDNKLAVQKRDGGTTNTIAITNTLITGKIYYVTLTSSGTAYKLYVDGQPETLAVTGTNNGDWFADIAGRDNIAIGVSQAASPLFFFNGMIDSIKVRSVQLTDAEVLAEYHEGAQKLTYRNTFEDAPVSIVNIASGTIGDFEIDSGSATLVADANNHWLKNNTGGNGSAASIEPSLYGTWQWTFNYATDSKYAFMPISSQNTIKSATGQDGYLVGVIADNKLVCSEINNGVQANFIITAEDYVAPDTDYEFRMTKDYVSLLSFYIRGGAYTDWTLIVEATDVKSFEAQYVNFTGFGADAQITDIHHWLGVLDPTTYPELV